jgi:cyclopropane fatty-acyl-phospholipid synthase-like methyltransferase
MWKGIKLYIICFMAFSLSTSAQEDTNKSNHMMHKTSTEELIKRFESPERDAYQKPEAVLTYLGELKGKTIEDIGAGSGYFSVKLAAKGAHVIAADVDDVFLAHIKKRIQEEQISNIEVRKIPLDNPALKTQEADIVLVVNTYHHIEKRPAYFSLVKKGLKANGELVIIDFFKTEVPVGPPVDHKFSIDEVVAELKEAGYSSFEVNVNLLPYQFIIKAK